MRLKTVGLEAAVVVVGLDSERLLFLGSCIRPIDKKFAALPLK